MMNIMTITSRPFPVPVTTEHQLYVPGNPYNVSELSAMAFHGMLRPQFGPFYVDVDVPDSASQRAKSVRMVGDHLIGNDWTATLLTAAWIHLGGQAPELFEAATAATTRKHARSRLMPSAIRSVDYLSRAEISDDDLQVIGGVIVTSPELTVVDLLRIGATERHQIRATELLPRVNMQSLRTRLDSQQALPGMRTARELFAALMSDDAIIAELAD